MPRLEVDKKFDPTGTTRIRAGFVAETNRRTAQFASGLRSLINENDLFSLKGPNLYSTITGGRLEDKIFILHNSIDALNESSFSGPWAHAYIAGAYTKGYNDGLTGARPTARFGGRLPGLCIAAESELAGILGVVKQQVARVVTHGLQQGQSPAILARLATGVVAQVHNQRFNPYTNTIVVDAHAHGKLDAFVDSGITSVGIIPEHKPARIARINDARRPSGGGGFEAVWVTAGDSFVCQECQGFEGQVMPIEQARGMIPLHANCRCTWEPADTDD